MEEILVAGAIIVGGLLTKYAKYKIEKNKIKKNLIKYAKLKNKYKVDKYLGYIEDFDTKYGTKKLKKYKNKISKYYEIIEPVIEQKERKPVVIKMKNKLPINRSGKMI